MRMRRFLGNLLGLPGPLTGLGFTLLVALVLIFIFGWVFVEVADDLLEAELDVFDAKVAAIIRAYVDPQLTIFMKIVSDMGGNWKVLGVVGISVSWIVFKHQKHAWDALMVQICLWGGWLANLALKAGFKRERPLLDRLVEVGGFSFPSGHSMISVAFYGMIMYIAYINMPPSRWRWMIVCLIGIFICLVGISRVYLGVHYASDVVAGFAAGGIWVLGCIVALETIRYYKGKNKKIG